MKLRSLLFVPADRPHRFTKAASSGADAIILDLEDSVGSDRKEFARDAVRKWLECGQFANSFVRINPLDSGLTASDLAAVLPARPRGLILPKAEGAASIYTLIELASTSLPLILPIATETAAAVFELGSYRSVAKHLAGLTWGAEDLPAAIGAVSAREDDGSYTAPYELVRSLTLFGAHAAGVPAIETVFPSIDDPHGLARYVRRARRDGFTGMMAIHPSQIPEINFGFKPSQAEISLSREIVEAFAAEPHAGALKLNGKMIDRPHLLQAERILAAVEVGADEKSEPS